MLASVWFLDNCKKKTNIQGGMCYDYIFLQVANISA